MYDVNWYFPVISVANSVASSKRAISEKMPNSQFRVVYLPPMPIKSGHSAIEKA